MDHTYRKQKRRHFQGRKQHGMETVKFRSLLANMDDYFWQNMDHGYRDSEKSGQKDQVSLDARGLQMWLCECNFRYNT